MRIADNAGRSGQDAASEVILEDGPIV